MSTGEKVIAESSYLTDLAWSWPIDSQLNTYRIEVSQSGWIFDSFKGYRCDSMRIGEFLPS